MANLNPAKITGIVVALLLMGVLLPIGLADLVNYNGTYTNATGSVLGVNATVGTLLGTVVPIMALVGIVVMMIKRN